MRVEHQPEQGGSASARRRPRTVPVGSVGVSPAPGERRHAARATRSATIDSNELQAVGRAGQRVDRVLGVGHQADDVAARVADAGDVGDRAVGVLSGAVAKHDLAVRLSLASRSPGANQRPLMCLTGIESRSPGSHPPVAIVAVLTTSSSTWRQTKRSPSLGSSAPGQQARLAEHLEAVADSEHGPAGVGELAHRPHHRREAGDRAGAQVVAVGEAAGNHDRVDSARARYRRARRARPRRPARRRAPRRARRTSPGTEARRTSSRCGPAQRRRYLLYLVVLDQGIGEQLLAEAVEVGAVSASSSTMRPTRTCETPSNPSAGSARSTALPCGSRMPSLGLISTRAFTASG